jgi:hypothetical protein
MEFTRPLGQGWRNVSRLIKTPLYWQRLHNIVNCSFYPELAILEIRRSKAFKAFLHPFYPLHLNEAQSRFSIPVYSCLLSTRGFDTIKAFGRHTSAVVNKSVVTEKLNCQTALIDTSCSLTTRRRSKSLQSYRFAHERYYHHHRRRQRQKINHARRLKLASYVSVTPACLAGGRARSSHSSTTA